MRFPLASSIFLCPSLSASSVYVSLPSLGSCTCTLWLIISYWWRVVFIKYPTWWEIDDSRLLLLGHNRETPNQWCRKSEIAGKIEKTRFNVENPCGKNHGSARLQLWLYAQKCTMASSKATTLSSLSSPQAAVYTEASTSSLSHGCSLSLPSLS